MGSFAQEWADKYGLDREQMDNYAIQSLRRAQRAIAEGDFEEEIAPVTVKGRKGQIDIDMDEPPRNARVDRIPHLKPAFSKEGTITAANSSSISDGAAALVLMTENRARSLGLRPLARIVAHASHAQHPSEFSLAPIGSINKVLNKADWSVDILGR